MRYLKCNLPKERHEEILGKFWHYPTQEEEDAVHDLFTPHVFFETYGSKREAWAVLDIPQKQEIINGWKQQFEGKQFAEQQAGREQAGGMVPESYMPPADEGGVMM